ncbi:MAG: DUF4864 domain-containing protein [Rhodobacteraceae bacterium]|nr:DUF4864 domain-containing protein [Paracoccaceae bacterium]
MAERLGALILGLWLAMPAWAQSAAEAVQAVIGAQMSAFEAGDEARAFGYASPGLRRFFGSSERFGAMVRQGYPMVWRPGAVRYLGLEGQGDARRQIIEITDGEGQTHRLEYSMIETPEGWRIDGVRFLPMPPGLS